MSNFPGVKLKGGTKRGVLVDVYELPEDEGATLARIDRYEGHFPEAPDQSLYIRREVKTLDNERMVTVYEYRFDPPFDPITSGDWISYEAEQLSENKGL